METLVRASSDESDVAGTVSPRMAVKRPTATIVLVEVEPLLTDSIKYTLERDGHRIVATPTRTAGLAAMAVERPGLVMVELDQPSPEIAEFCRKAHSLCEAAVILITTKVANGQSGDPLEWGADDLLTKPFSMREIAHRVTEQLRRGSPHALSLEWEDEILSVGPVEMDVAHHEVRVRGALQFFPPKEFALLEALLRSRGRLVKRDRLIRTVWGAQYYGDGKTLDTHVKRLRQKIEADPRRPLHLVVVRGMGYRLIDGVNRSQTGDSQAGPVPLPNATARR